MSQTLPRPMTADEFLVWDTLQPDARHELIDGLPVAKAWAPVGMTGATMRHDDILGNVYALLWNQLRGQKCRPFTADVAVRATNGNVRRPDVGVRCPPFTDKGMAAPFPVLAVEVLSPSTRSIDLIRKLEEYKEIASMRYILLIDPDVPQVIFWSRGGAGWNSLTLSGLDGVVEMADPTMILALKDIYEGIALPPRLVG